MGVVVGTSRQVAAFACCLAPWAAQAGALCDADLSAAQRARFALATADCASPIAAPTMAREADALVATAGVPPVAAPAPSESAPRESAHLQLFTRPGVVATGGDTTAATPPRTPSARPRAAAPKAGASAARVQRAVTLAPAIDAVARRNDIDPLLLHAIAWVESRHDPAARSQAGALGVMQVIPATGQRFGVARAEALHDAATNLEVSAAYLKTLQQRFGGDLALVLAAYNAGEGAVERSGRRVPANGETPGYVRAVLAQYRALTAIASAHPRGAAR